MPPNKATKARERGQVLPLGLALLVCAVLLLGLCSRLGNRMLQQERVRMRADLTAYSGGILIARSLNILTYTEKIRMTGEILEYIPFVSALGAAMANGVGGFQKFFIPAAPWLIEGDVVMVGNANELLAVPLWNQPDALGGLSLSRLKPDLKVKSSQGGSGSNSSSQSSSSSGSSNSQGSGSSDAAQQGASQGGSAFGIDLGPLGKLFSGGGDGSGDDSDAYHYQSTQDGQRHELGSDDAGAVSERGAGGKQVTRYKDDRTHRYVAKDKQKRSDGYGLIDEGGHYLAVLAVQTGDEQQPAQRPGLAFGCSQVRIAGGDVNAWDVDHGADYAPFFVPVRNASDSQMGDGAKTVLQGLELLQRMGIDSGGLGDLIQAADQALLVQH